MKKTIMLCTLILTSCIEPGSYKNQEKIISSWAKSISMKNPTVELISARELMQRLEQKDFTMVLVDARSTEEQMTSTLPGAMPKQAMDQDPNAYKDKIIIIYSTIGERSVKYALKLEEAGFKTMSLNGGVLSWAQEGYFFNHQGKQTKKVRFINDAWNVLPKDYEGVSP